MSLPREGRTRSTSKVTDLAVLLVVLVLGSSLGACTGTGSQPSERGAGPPTPGTTRSSDGGGDLRGRGPFPVHSHVDRPEFRGIWPEATRQDLAIAQLRVARGLVPWRLDGASTAERFAVDVLGWDRDEVELSTVRRSPSRWIVELRRSTSLAEGAGVGPTVVVDLERPPGGSEVPSRVWSVVSANTDTIELERVVADGGLPTLAIEGTSQSMRDADFGISVELSDDAIGQVRVPTEEEPSSVGDDGFTFETFGSLPAGRPLTVMVSTLDAEKGLRTGVDAFSLAPAIRTTGEARPSGFFPVMWPDAIRHVSDQARRDATADHPTWRLDPVATAERFATDVLGWSRTSTRGFLQELGGIRAWVVLWNEELTTSRHGSGRAPLTIVTLERLLYFEKLSSNSVRSRPSPAWSIAEVDSDLIAVDGLSFGGVPGTDPLSVPPSFGVLKLSGTTADGAGPTCSSVWNHRDRMLPAIGRWDQDPYPKRFVQSHVVPVTGNVSVLVCLLEPKSGLVMAADAFPVLIDPSL